MATVGQVYYNVIDKNSGSCLSSGPDIFSDIVSKYGAKQFNKIGVQARPGTRMVMNNSKTIMVGASGIYELDDDITITNMYFIRPKKYEEDIEASNKAIEDGIAKIKQADLNRTNELSKLGAEPSRDNTQAFNTYWSKYNSIQTTFIKEYNEGLKLFQTGSNGIYRLPNPDNIQAPENYDDLFNVIVDFVYE